MVATARAKGHTGTPGHLVLEPGHRDRLRAAGCRVTVSPLPGPSHAGSGPHALPGHYADLPARTAALHNPQPPAGLAAQ